MTYSADLKRHLSTPNPGPYGYKSTLRTLEQERMMRAPRRAYSISWLTTRGHVNFDTIMAPSIDIVDTACANVARGTLILTSDGPVAVEDLLPGMDIITSEHGPLPLAWIGSFDLSPRELRRMDRTRLYRITAESMGFEKPGQDLMLTSRAHALLRHRKCRDLYNIEAAYAPIHAFEDGETIISVTPMSPISVFNLAFDRHATITASGVEVEAFHPAAFTSKLLNTEMIDTLLRLFPNARSLDAFGPKLVDRLTIGEVQMVRSSS